MSLLDDPSQVLHRFIAPELREINERLDKLEGQINEYEHRSAKRHDELLYALRQITQWTDAQDRLYRRKTIGMPIE